MVNVASFQERAQLEDVEPPQERKIQLCLAYMMNIVKGKAPYTDVEIHSRSELLWIMRERGWSGENDAKDKQRVNLSGAILDGIDLSEMLLYDVNLNSAHLHKANLSAAVLNGADLSNAFLWEANLKAAHFDDLTNLSGAFLSDADLSDAILAGTNLSNSVLWDAKLCGAHLDKANLSKAILGFANLSAANLMDTNFSGARLGRANLSGATIDRANLSGARLRQANISNSTLRRVDLSGAILDKVDLRGANLEGARMDVGTRLRSTKIDERTLLGDVVWNGASLTQIDWGQVPTLGEEMYIRTAKTPKESIEACRNAARAYRGLAVTLRGQGLLIPASRYRLREQRLERQALLRERKLGAWLFSALVNLLSGYGEKLERTLLAYFLIVLMFAAAYFSMTHFLEESKQFSRLHWDEALVLSLVSFHGRGFFPNMLYLGDWVARLGVLEAIIGLFIELTFVVTFSRRFLGT